MIRFSGFVILALIIFQHEVRAQGSSCAQTLRLARATYEQGRLHELPAMLEGCLKNTEDEDGFTKQERVEAYRILTLAYIYLEEPAEADKMMLQLMSTDHFFEPNPDVDPAEFQALFKKFRKNPVFMAGLRLSGNFTFASTTGVHYVSPESVGNGKYGTAFGFQVAGIFEKEFFYNSKSKILSRITVAPEIAFTTRSFVYSNSGVYRYDSLSRDITNGTLESTYKQSWLDVNAMIQYKLKKEKTTWNSYVTVGPGISLLLSASNPTLFTSPNSTVTGPDVQTKENYKSLMNSVIVGYGVKRRVGELYINFDVRYQYGFTEPIDPSTRTNSELAFDYSMKHNDFRQSTIYVSLGVLLPKFKPKKLIN